jgi:hypothetical protein
MELISNDLGGPGPEWNPEKVLIASNGQVIWEHPEVKRLAVAWRGLYGQRDRMAQVIRNISLEDFPGEEGIPFLG